MYKPVHCPAKQDNKSTSRQTLVLPLLSHYYVDLIADLVLVLGVIIRQVVFVTMSTFAYNFGTLVFCLDITSLFCCDIRLMYT